PEKFIPTMLARLENEQSLPLYGDGLYVREWMYVEDHAQAILLLFEEGKSGERYNISTEEERSNKEVINRLLDEYGRDASAIEYVEDRKGHDRRYAVDSSKIRNLGWAPQHGFEESLSKVVRWYKHNQTWWQKALNNAA
ncbi:MAG: GDP-mannose 4,6-dehydratase, partial [Candidatus Paceibacteria bacterium]